MKTAVFCFSENGAALAKRICELLSLPYSDVHTIEKFALPHGFTAHKSVCADMGELFHSHDALIFICACGIAVRDIAPYLKNKTVDPAVLVLDDTGRFVIPILSGHIGGANRLAVDLAERLGATPVITTATDRASRFSCDAWAAEHNCAISSMRVAKDISAAILNEDISLSSEFVLPEILPCGLNRNDSDIGIYIGIHSITPYKTTLRLIPRIVTLGIGCRRGVSRETISAAVRSVLEDANIDLCAVERVASIDKKSDEVGLLEFVEVSGLPIEFYSADELLKVEGEFSESEFVRSTVGVGNVCERSALYRGGRIIINKTARDGVTVAAAIRNWRIEF